MATVETANRNAFIGNLQRSATDLVLSRDVHWRQMVCELPATSLRTFSAPKLLPNFTEIYLPLPASNNS